MSTKFNIYTFCSLIRHKREKNSTDIGLRANLWLPREETNLIIGVAHFNLSRATSNHYSKKENDICLAYRKVKIMSKGFDLGS